MICMRWKHKAYEVYALGLYERDLTPVVVGVRQCAAPGLLSLSILGWWCDEAGIFAYWAGGPAGGDGGRLRCESDATTVCLCFTECAPFNRAA